MAKVHKYPEGTLMDTDIVDTFYAYVSKEGHDIVVETINDLRANMTTKLYNCFRLSYKKQKKHYVLAELEIKIKRIIDENEM